MFILNDSLLQAEHLFYATLSCDISSCMFVFFFRYTVLLQDVEDYVLFYTTLSCDIGILHLFYLFLYTLHDSPVT